jgi:hypothetical protein
LIIFWIIFHCLFEPALLMRIGLNQSTMPSLS